MKSNVINFLYRAIPFLVTIALWRTTYPIWNPAGVLALIPIFYYTFVRPTPGFAGFGLLFCFLIDYNMNLPLFWMAMFCLLYAANGFQNYIDISISRFYGIGVFALWFLLGCIILAISGKTINGAISALWIFIWTCAMYIPIIAITRGGRHD